MWLCIVASLSASVWLYLFLPESILLPDLGPNERTSLIAWELGRSTLVPPPYFVILALGSRKSGTRELPKIHGQIRGSNDGARPLAPSDLSH